VIPLAFSAIDIAICFPLFFTPILFTFPVSNKSFSMAYVRYSRPRERGLTTSSKQKYSAFNDGVPSNGHSLYVGQVSFEQKQDVSSRRQLASTFQPRLTIRVPPIEVHLDNTKVQLKHRFILTDFKPKSKLLH
jgi:hypothetical protein